MFPATATPIWAERGRSQINNQATMARGRFQFIGCKSIVQSIWSVYNRWTYSYMNRIFNKVRSSTAARTYFWMLYLTASFFLSVGCITKARQISRRTAKPKRLVSNTQEWSSKSFEWKVLESLQGAKEVIDQGQLQSLPSNSMDTCETYICTCWILSAICT